MQEWMIDAKNILNYELFTLSEQPVTPFVILTLVVVVAITVLAGGIVKRIINKRLTQLETGPRYTLARLVQYLVYVVGFMLALEIVGIDMTALTVLAGTLGIGIGFGLQDVAADFISGLVLLLERPIKVNDYVTTEEDIRGRVESIDFRTTRIVTNDNITVLVPNSDLIDDHVINWSHRDDRVRLRIPIGVAYGTDARKVERLLLEIAKDEPAVLDDPAPVVRFKDFGDSSLNFELLAWTNEPRKHYAIKSNLNFAINDVFAREEIEIPFPQRDLHVRSAPGLEGLRSQEREAVSAA